MGPRAGGPDGLPPERGEFPAVRRLGAFPRRTLAAWLIALALVGTLGLAGHLVPPGEVVPSAPAVPTGPAPTVATPARSPMPAFPALAAAAPPTAGLVVARHVAVVRTGAGDGMQVRIRDAREIPPPAGAPRTIPFGVFLAIAIDYHAVRGTWTVGANDWRPSGIARFVHVPLEEPLPPTVVLGQGTTLTGGVVLEAPGWGEVRLLFRPSAEDARFDVRLRDGPRFAFRDAGPGVPAAAAVQRAVAAIPPGSGSVSRVLDVTAGPRGWFVGQDGDDPEEWVWAVVVAGSFGPGRVVPGIVREPAGQPEETALVLLDHATGTPVLVTAPAW